MKTKYTALPLILALATVGCSVEQTNYPNFKACYKATGDANDCIEYIEQKSFDYSPTTSEPAPVNPASADQSSVPSTGLDGSSALTGAAVGAVAGYALANAGNNSRNNNFLNSSSNNSKDRNNVFATGGAAPVAGSNSLSKSSSTNVTTKSTTAPASKSTTSKPSLTKSSSTTRGGFGSTGVK